MYPASSAVSRRAVSKSDSPSSTCPENIIRRLCSRMSLTHKNKVNCPWGVSNGVGRMKSAVVSILCPQGSCDIL